MLPLEFQAILKVDQNSLNQAKGQIQRTFNAGSLRIDTFKDLNADNFIEVMRRVRREATGLIGEFTRVGDTVNNVFRRFSAYLIASSGILGSLVALKTAVGEALNFQRELIKVQQVSGDSASTIKELENEITNLAKSYGASSNELVKAAVTIRQAGISTKDTTKALEALAQASLAPNFGTMAETTEGLIALYQQFGKNIDQTKEDLSALNAVANAFAVESKDLVSAVQRSGGAMKVAGADAKELFALFTSIRGTTRESADAVATGLRTIAGRLQRPETIEFLKNLGIHLRYTRDEATALGDSNLESKFVGIYEAIRRISEVAGGYGQGDTRLSALVEQVGGLRQLSRVIPLIQQFSTAQEAYNTALGGSISLQVNALQAQDSFLNRLTKIKETFLELGRTLIESRGFEQFISFLDSAARTAIKLLDALGPLIPALGAIAGASLLGGFVTGFGRSLFNPQGSVFARGRAAGTVIPGYGGGDKHPALLEGGEAIIPKHNVRKYAAIIPALVAGTLPGFADGFIPFNNVSADVQNQIQKYIKEFASLTGARPEDLIDKITGNVRRGEFGTRDAEFVQHKGGERSININAKAIEQNLIGQGKLRELIFHELSHALDYSIGGGVSAAKGLVANPQTQALFDKYNTKYNKKAYSEDYLQYLKSPQETFARLLTTQLESGNQANVSRTLATTGIQKVNFPQIFNTEPVKYPVPEGKPGSLLGLAQSAVTYPGQRPPPFFGSAQRVVPSIYQPPPPFFGANGNFGGYPAPSFVRPYGPQIPLNYPTSSFYGALGGGGPNIPGFLRAFGGGGGGDGGSLGPVGGSGGGIPIEDLNKLKLTSRLGNIGYTAAAIGIPAALGYAAGQSKDIKTSSVLGGASVGAGIGFAAGGIFGPLGGLVLGGLGALVGAISGWKDGIIEQEKALKKAELDKAVTALATRIDSFVAIGDIKGTNEAFKLVKDATTKSALANLKPGESFGEANQNELLKNAGLQLPAFQQLLLNAAKTQARGGAASLNVDANIKELATNISILNPQRSVAKVLKDLEKDFNTARKAFQNEQSGERFRVAINENIEVATRLSQAFLRAESAVKDFEGNIHDLIAIVSGGIAGGPRLGDIGLGHYGTLDTRNLGIASGFAGAAGAGLSETVSATNEISKYLPEVLSRIIKPGNPDQEGNLTKEFLDSFADIGKRTGVQFNQKVLNVISDKLGELKSEEIFKKFKEGPEKFANLLTEELGAPLQALQNIADVYKRHNDALHQQLQEYNRFNEILNSLNEQFTKQAEFSHSVRTAIGAQISGVSQTSFTNSTVANRPFLAEQSRLTGLRNPSVAEVVRQLKDLDKSRTQQENIIKSRIDRGQNVDSFIIRLNDINTQLANTHKALANFGQSTQNLSILQQKLAAIEADKASKNQLFEKYVTGGVQGRFQLQQGAAAALLLSKFGIGKVNDAFFNLGRQRGFAVGGPIGGLLGGQEGINFGGQVIKQGLDFLRSIGQGKLSAFLPGQKFVDQKGNRINPTGNELADRLLGEGQVYRDKKGQLVFPNFNPGIKNKIKPGKKNPKPGEDEEKSIAEQIEAILKTNKDALDALITDAQGKQTFAVNQIVSDSNKFFTKIEKYTDELQKFALSSELAKKNVEVNEIEGNRGVKNLLDVGIKTPEDVEKAKRILPEIQRFQDAQKTLKEENERGKTLAPDILKDIEKFQEEKGSQEEGATDKDIAEFVSGLQNKHGGFTKEQQDNLIKLIKANRPENPLAKIPAIRLGEGDIREALGPQSQRGKEAQKVIDENAGIISKNAPGILNKPLSPEGINALNQANINPGAQAQRLEELRKAQEELKSKINALEKATNPQQQQQGQPAPGQVAPARDNSFGPFPKLGALFDTAKDVFNNFTTNFGKQIDALASIPNKIDMNLNQKVEVILNGADVLARMEPGIRQIADGAVNKAMAAIGSQLRDQNITINYDSRDGQVANGLGNLTVTINKAKQDA